MWTTLILNLVHAEVTEGPQILLGGDEEALLSGEESDTLENRQDDDMDSNSDDGNASVASDTSVPEPEGETGA